MNSVPEPGRASDRAGLVDEHRRERDLRLLGAAGHYDLSLKSERRRSAEDLATFFFRVCKALSPDLFVEAGAKDGSASRRAKRFLRNARIVAFEANPYTYREFRDQNPENVGVEYLQLALSDQPGPVTFHIRERPAGLPSPDGHGSLMERHEGYKDSFSEVTVDATTLDGHFADYRFSTCAMWIDVEGAAAQVLQGGKSLLHKASVVMIEVEDKVKWKGAWLKPQVDSYLGSAGLVPVARDFEYAYQYNIVFVRDSILDDPQFRLRLAQYISARSALRRRSTRPSGD